jgi:hypothetical protein
MKSINQLNNDQKLRYTLLIKHINKYILWLYLFYPIIFSNLKISDQGVINFFIPMYFLSYIVE